MKKAILFTLSILTSGHFLFAQQVEAVNTKGPTGPMVGPRLWAPGDEQPATNKATNPVKIARVRNLFMIDTVGRCPENQMSR